ncbi:hypothetical protein Cni_G15679 [Canna indica]|uniref:C2H2-type domain-containing protein n=1 Tax=Canna indica TaxID=4628 RepID=A0AAQ3QDI3_9LILI|nr:hypothetical protein Cni_G15679 [Canna indica]
MEKAARRLGEDNGEDRTLIQWLGEKNGVCTARRGLAVDWKATARAVHAKGRPPLADRPEGVHGRRWQKPLLSPSRVPTHTPSAVHCDSRSGKEARGEDPETTRSAAMEQAARYWMWTRTSYRGSGSRPDQLSSHQIPRLIVDESWEEKAFAEDTAGHLGGCIWPPRSYSCSFCRREFRSAQALGGHMNVHRRDRAQLKLSSSLTGEATDDQRQHHPAQVISHMAFNAAPANPNPNSGVLASLLPPRFPAKATEKLWSENALLSPSFSSSRHLIVVPEIKIEGDELGPRESGFRRPWRDVVTGVCDEEITSSKRRRIEPAPVFFIRAGDNGGDDQQQVESQVLHHNLVEELDLELRLGDAPKLK